MGDWDNWQTVAGTGSSSPFIKGEPDQLFSSNNQRFIGVQQSYNTNAQSNGRSINPNSLTVDMSVPSGSYLGSSFQSTFNQQATIPNPSFARGISILDDNDLLEGLDFQDHSNQNYSRLDDFDFNDPRITQNIYSGQSGISINHHARRNNVCSRTSHGDRIRSPSVQLRQLQQQQQFGNYLQSPNYFAGSPLVGSGTYNGLLDDSYMNARLKPRPSLSTMQRKSSKARSPLTPKTPGSDVQSLNLGGTEPGSFLITQPIRTNGVHRHQKTTSGTWDPQSVNSLTSFPGSDFSSPLLARNPQISDILKAGSLPPSSAQGIAAPAMQVQEVKRRRRRESHNLVERRRRDNINKRIQELSHLIPMHRLEDEKVRKALQNNSPLSPTIGSTSMSPLHDKGPNKGDVLNGAVSWIRDLMWMLHVKLQQQEELANLISELGGQYPLEPTEEEQRMLTELMDAIHKNNVSTFSYSRTPGTGLRVPKHTDVKGDPTGVNASDAIEGALAA